MNFRDYFNKVDREYKAPVTGDVVNFELDSVRAVTASVVEHTDNSVTVLLDDAAWKLLDQNKLISEGSVQPMAEFVLTFERNGEKIAKKFLHQPPMESAGITADFVRNIAKSNALHGTMVEQGYKLRHAEARLVETDQLPESEVTVIARNKAATEAKVTFECHFKKVDASRTKLFLESYDCASKGNTGSVWSLPVKTRI